MNLADLPVLVLQEIIPYLNVREKCYLRRVCKALRVLVDSIPQSLALYEARQASGKRWPFTNESIKETEMVEIATQSEADRFSFENPVFRSVRRLCMHQICNPTRLYSSLPFLEQLEVLRLKIYWNTKLNELTLKSPSLKVLFIEDCQQMNLQAPRLEKLYTRTSRHFDLNLKHPETLRFLECVVLNFTPGLVNLEELVCQRLDSSFDLNDYPKLKRLNICSTQDGLPEVQRVIEQRERLGHLNLEILICGFRKSIVTIKQDIIPHQHKFKFANSTHIAEFALNYPNLVGQIPFDFNIVYHELIDHFDPVPGDFFQKFSNIIDVSVRRQVNEQHFISFLRRSSVWYLKLATSFSQNLYDQLPSVKTIRLIEIVKAKKQTNFNFLGNFGHLEHVTLYHSQIPIDAIRRTFESSKYFYSFYNFRGVSDLSYNRMADNMLLTIKNYSIEDWSFNQAKSYCLDIELGGYRAYKFASLSEVISCIQEDERVREHLRLNGLNFN